MERRGKSRPVAAVTLALTAACAVSGCAVGPDFVQPRAAVETGWTASSASVPVAGDVETPQAWWARFADPTLDELLALARLRNPDVLAAAYRVEQAAAQLRIDRSAAWPSAQLQADIDYSNPDQASQLLGRDGDSLTSAQIGVAASWEPDFWGKARRSIQAGRADWLSSIAAWRAAEVSLDATVASTYFTLRTYQQRVQIAESNLAQQRENLRIARVRFEAGESSELDLRQAETQYEQTRSQVPPLRAAVAQAEHALATLVGEVPDFYHRQFGARATRPTAPTAVPGGIPRDLLRRRPDVRQAEYTAAAQSARIGQAQAALYPSLTLSGSLSSYSSDARGQSLNDVFSWGDPIQSVSAGLLLPLFDRGRLTAQVRVQDAAFTQAVLAYQAQVLKAQREVEDALVNIDGSLAALDSLRRATSAAKRSADLALLRYKSGETDYTTVTSADQSRLQVEDSLAQTEGDLLQAYVDAYRALGGGWSGEMDPPRLPVRESAATPAFPTTLR
ncbi:MAG: efflux transporter outer membrane subunit [Steroidobacteraceae bacterium]